MKRTLMRNAAPASNATKPQEAPTAAPAARHWALPDPAAYAVQKPVAAPVAKPETLDRRMVATLAKIAGSS